MTPDERKNALRAEVQATLQARIDNARKRLAQIFPGSIEPELLLIASRWQAQALWEIIDRLVEECAESQHQAADAIRREMRQWYASPAFQTYVDLRYGVVGRVLKALQDEQISLNRALECLAEIAHGATEITLPDTKEE